MSLELGSNDARCSEVRTSITEKERVVAPKAIGATWGPVVCAEAEAAKVDEERGGDGARNETCEVPAGKRLGPARREDLRAEEGTPRGGPRFESGTEGVLAAPLVDSSRSGTTATAPSSDSLLVPALASEALRSPSDSSPASVASRADRLGGDTYPTRAQGGIARLREPRTVRTSAGSS